MDDDREVAEMILDLCLRFGASVSTAYRVAGLFVEAINTQSREDSP